MQKVCVLDYGSGNVRSVMNAFSQYADCEISNSAENIRNASHLVLPGVGSFKESMSSIRENIEIYELLRELQNGKPFLGICVGMQVLATRGIEFEEASGLNVVPGVVSKLNSANNPLPHIGWNNLEFLESSAIAKGITDDDDFYFIHSFGFSEIERKNIVAVTSYGNQFPSIIASGNTFGVQFHPEKSQKSGRKIIENFLNVK